MAEKNEIKEDVHNIAIKDIFRQKRKIMMQDLAREITESDLSFEEKIEEFEKLISREEMLVYYFNFSAKDIMCSQRTGIVLQNFESDMKIKYETLKLVLDLEGLVQVFPRWYIYDFHIIFNNLENAKRGHDKLKEIGYIVEDINIASMTISGIESNMKKRECERLELKAKE